jgi:hypothetical protein
MTNMYFIRFEDRETMTMGMAPMSKILEVIDGDDLSNDSFRLVDGTTHECFYRNFEDSIVTVPLGLHK